MTLINTHTLFKELVASGMPETQAEVVSNAVLSIRDTDKFTTKEQFTFLEKEMATKVDLMEVKAELKSDIAELKTEIIGIKINMKWVMTFMKLIITLLLGILGVLIKSAFFLN